MAKVLPLRSGWRSEANSLGVRAAGVDALTRLVRMGIPISRLVHFQKMSGLSWEIIGRWVGVPPRTLVRRMKGGRLPTDESDRVLRAATIFDHAVKLFEGDATNARQWLQAPQRALGGQSPIDYSTTEVGAREVEDLIFRLEHGIFS